MPSAAPSAPPAAQACGAAMTALAGLNAVQQGHSRAGRSPAWSGRSQPAPHQVLAAGPRQWSSACTQTTGRWGWPAGRVSRPGRARQCITAWAAQGSSAARIALSALVVTAILHHSHQQAQRDGSSAGCAHVLAGGCTDNRGAATRRTSGDACTARCQRSCIGSA